VITWQSEGFEEELLGIYAQAYSVVRPFLVSGGAGSDSIVVKTGPKQVKAWINHNPASDPPDLTRDVPLSNGSEAVRR
jgi:hypothetical protein